MSLLLPLALQAGTITAESPIIRVAPAPGDDVAAYVRLRNSGPADRLVAVECACAATIEIHRVNRRPEGVSMDTEASLDIPAGGVVEIRPGSPLHLMVKATRPGLRPGADIPMTLRFERAAPIVVRFRAVEDTRAGWQALPEG